MSAITFSLSCAPSMNASFAVSQFGWPASTSFKSISRAMLVNCTEWTLDCQSRCRRGFIPPYVVGGPFGASQHSFLLLGDGLAEGRQMHDGFPRGANPEHEPHGCLHAFHADAAPVVGDI